MLRLANRGFCGVFGVSCLMQNRIPTDVESWWSAGPPCSCKSTRSFVPNRGVSDPKRSPIWAQFSLFRETGPVEGPDWKGCQLQKRWSRKGGFRSGFRRGLRGRTGFFSHPGRKKFLKEKIKKNSGKFSAWKFLKKIYNWLELMNELLKKICERWPVRKFFCWWWGLMKIFCWDIKSHENFCWWLKPEQNDGFPPHGLTGESIVASARIDWRRIRKDSSTYEWFIRTTNSRSSQRTSSTAGQITYSILGDR